MAMRWCLTLLLCAAAATAADAPVPRLDVETYTLDNGLRVILHEDHALPVVAVNVWYHVGSRREGPGRTGLAHLLEHLMFQGSEHHDQDHARALQRVGGRANGATDRDRMVFWADVPADQVEFALWLEADRMAGLLPALTQAELDHQRDVLRAEKLRAEGEPYAPRDVLLYRLLFPAGHPYRHPVIGDLDDLAAVTLDDVASFHRRHIVPGNASLCVAGDFDPVAVQAMIARHFGDIPPGPATARLARWVPRLGGERRAVAEDDVALPRLHLAWHTPGRYHPGDAEFDLLATILAGGRTSRLHRALIEERELAQEVRAHQESRELSGTFVIEVTAAPGVPLARVEAAVEDELDRLRDKGVRREELARARTRQEADLVRALQRLGGTGGRAERLNRYAVFTGDPDYLPRDLERFRRATTRDMTYHIRTWLDRDRRAVLHVVPRQVRAVEADTTARTVRPPAGPPVAFTPPAVRSDTLDNGLVVHVVERRTLPLVDARLSVRSGWSADPADRLGAAAMTADLLDEAAAGRTAPELAARADELGARLGTGSFFDGSSVTVDVVGDRLDDGLALLADVGLRPDFPDDAFERVRRSHLARHRREEATPRTAAVKELQRRLFGDGHPYAQPYTGTGTAATLAALTPDDVRAFHARWYRPDNAALILVGDVDLATARRLAQRHFGDWEPGAPEAPPVPEPAPAGGARLVIVDRPGAAQSTIVGGRVLPPRPHPDYETLQTLNAIVGGQYDSRINTTLRGERGWTYGARSRYAAFRDAGIFVLTAPVPVEHTAAALDELLAELAGVGGAQPVTPGERDDACRARIRRFPQRFATWRDISRQLDTLVRNGLPTDSWRTFPRTLAGIDAAELTACARDHLDPDAMVWIVVGDRARIEEPLAALGLGEPAPPPATD